MRLPDLFMTRGPKFSSVTAQKRSTINCLSCSNGAWVLISLFRWHFPGSAVLELACGRRWFMLQSGKRNTRFAILICKMKRSERELCVGTQEFNGETHWHLNYYEKCYRPVCVGRSFEIISTDTFNTDFICTCITSQYNLLIEIYTLRLRWRDCLKEGKSFGSY